MKFTTIAHSIQLSTKKKTLWLEYRCESDMGNPVIWGPPDPISLEE